MCESDFSKFIKNLTEVFIETSKELYNNKNIVLGTSNLKETFFMHVDSTNNRTNESCDEKGPSGSEAKINNRTYFFREDHLVNLINNLTNDSDEYMLTGSFFGNPLSLFPQLFPQYTPTKALYSFYKKLKNIIEENACKWFDIEKTISMHFFNTPKKYKLEELENEGVPHERISSYYTTLICYYLFLQLAYVGFKSHIFINHRNITEISLENFKETLSANKRIAFVGDFGCGKTTALKLLAQNKRDNIFYLDAKYERIGKQEIFYTLRPDIDFWNNNTKFNKIKQNNPNFIFPNFPEKNFSEKNFYSKFLNSIPENNVLIIDHISKEHIDIISELKSLPCKVIFVLNTNVDISNKKIKVYKYDNKDLLRKKINSAYTNNEDIDELFFNKIYRTFGQDIFLYDLVIAAHKKYKQESSKTGEENFDFIRELVKLRGFNNYDKFFTLNDNKFKSIAFTINYRDRKDEYSTISRRETLEKHIANIYGSFFDDIEYINSPSTEREKTKQLELLRILGRLKYEDVSYSQIKEIFSILGISGETLKDFTNKLKKLNWIKKDKICIPDIIAHAFSRKNSINKHQYSETLEKQFFTSVRLEHFSYSKVDRKLYTIIYKIMFDECIFLDIRTENMKNKLLKENTEDEIERKVALYSLDKKSLLQAILSYTYKYNEQILFNDVMQYANERLHKEPLTRVWNKICNINDNDLEDIVNYKAIKEFEDYIDDPFALLTLMNYYNLKLTDILTEWLVWYCNGGPIAKYAQLFQNHFLSRFVKYLNDFDFFIKSYKDFLNNKENPYLTTDIIAYSSIYQAYLNIYYVMVNKKVEKGYFQLKDLCLENEVIRIKENYLLLVGLVILFNGKIPGVTQSLRDVIDEFETLIECIGDLPDNSNKIVELVKKHIIYLNTKKHNFYRGEYAPIKTIDKNQLGFLENK